MTVARRPRIACGMRRGASHEVLGSCSTIQRVESTVASIARCHARGLPSRFVPSSGFFTLSTACSSTACPALFRAGSAHGVPRPSELFPRPEPWHLSVPCCLLAIHHHRRVGRRLHRRTAVLIGAAARTGEVRVWLQGFAPRYESVAKAVDREAGDLPDALLGFGSLQGAPSRPGARVLPPSSSLELSIRTARACASADFTCSPEFRPGRDWPCSAQHGRPSWGFPPHQRPPRFGIGPVLAH
jgi:hypothetical protein